jgi:Lrp/AsnC family transcriptional regulator, leucine-responsive regulatory protein
MLGTFMVLSVGSAAEPGWRLLTALQQNARSSLTELGRNVGLTPAAVGERLRRMEEAGVIEGYRAPLRIDRLGFPLQAFIQLRIGQLRHQTLPRVIAAASDMTEVLELHRITGEDASC